jgi:hypothetical protein
MNMIIEMLAPVAQETECRSTIERNGKAIESNAAYLVATLKSSNLQPQAQEVCFREIQKRRNFREKEGNRF